MYENRACIYVTCHSNETRAPVANPPNGAQLEGTPYHSTNLHPGPHTVVWECGDEQTDTQTAVTIYFTAIGDVCAVGQHGVMCEVKW